MKKLSIKGFEQLCSDIDKLCGNDGESSAQFDSDVSQPGVVSARMLAGKIHNNVVEFLNSATLGKTHLFDNQFNIKAASESYVSEKAADFSQLRMLSSNLMNLCEKCDTPKEYVAPVMRTLAVILNRYADAAMIVPNHWASGSAMTNSDGSKLTQAYEFYGKEPVLAGDFIYDNTGMPVIAGKEDFGQDIDKILPDIRAAMTVVLMKPHRGLTERLFHTRNITVPMIRYGIVFDELFDMNKAMNASGEVRNAWDHRTPAIHLYTNPEQMAFTPIRLVPKASNNTAGDKVVEDGVLKFDTECDLFDLSSDPTDNRTRGDYWSRIADSVAIEEIRIKVKTTKGGTAGNETVEETFNINVQGNAQHRLLMMEQPTSSGDRGTLMKYYFQINKDTLTAAGVKNTLFASMVDPTIVYLSCNVAARIDRKTSVTYAHCDAHLTVTTTDGSTPTTDMKALVAPANVTITPIGWKIDARWSEENVRMSSLIVRQNVTGKTYELPATRTFMVDSSLQQMQPENVIDTINNMQQIGVDNRNLKLIMELAEHINTEQAKEQRDPMYRANADNRTLNMQYVAGSKVNPTVLIRKMSLLDANVRNIRAGDTFGDIRTFADSFMQKLFSDLHVRSLYPNQLDQGERPVYKVVTSVPILENILSVPYYHDTMNKISDSDSLYGSSKTEFTHTLPSGIEMRCMPCTFKYMWDKILIIPFRPNAAESEYNFGHNYEFGTFAAHYMPQVNGGVANRLVVNVRNYPIPENPLVILLTVEGLNELLPDITTN